MALARKLKNFNLYNEGRSFLGLVLSLTLPELTRKFEDWRGGGMMGAIKVDMGQEPIELEWTLGGPDVNVLRQFGAQQHDAVGLRFVGAYANEGDGSYDSVEIVVRGRHETIGMGEAKVGEDTEMKVKTACSYYRLIWNGVDVIEIDFVANTMVVGGKDLMADQRAAMGLA